MAQLTINQLSKLLEINTDITIYGDKQWDGFHCTIQIGNQPEGKQYAFLRKEKDNTPRIFISLDTMYKTIVEELGVKLIIEPPFKLSD